MAEKKIPTQAERQAQIRNETEESTARILSFIRGAAKAVTTDVPGFIMDVVDRIATGEEFGKNDNSEKLFSKATGTKKGDEKSEQLGGMLDPKAMLKSIILPAFLTKSIKDIKTAERALEKGISGDKVYETLGVFKLPENIDDGVMRSVLHPGLAEFNPRALTYEGLNINKIQELGEVVNFPELYRLVPDLQSYRLTPEPGLPVNSAYHNSKDKLIGLGNASSKEELMKSLLHEVQHGIQTRFDMNTGANPTMFYEDVTKADRAKNILAKQANAGDKKAAQNWNILDLTEQEATRQYKKVAGEVEARAVEKMRSEYGPITKPLTYYGDAYDLNRMILSPSQVPPVDSSPTIRKIIDEALASQKK